jgi:hypothetical protein
MLNKSSEFEQIKAKNGFYIKQPENWFSATEFDIIENVDRFDMSKKQINDLIKSNRGSVLILAYTKYDPAEYVGLIPTVQVNLRPNPRNSFEKFKMDIVESAEQLKTQFTNYVITEKLTEIEIDKIKSLYFKSEFELTIGEEVSKVKSWNYVIPVNDFFYQINFSDGFNNEDCSDLFEELITTVKVAGTTH